MVRAISTTVADLAQLLRRRRGPFRSRCGAFGAAEGRDILYDRDEHGEYFQLYSMTYSEGFFFEIVERRGYKGYGAPNAIFRIAALKKALRPEGMPRV